MIAASLLALCLLQTFPGPLDTATDPRVTHTVTPTYSVAQDGTISQKVVIPTGVTSAHRSEFPEWTGDLVLIELRGFPVGSTPGDYRIEVDHDGFHNYDWDYLESTSNNSYDPGDVHCSVWPEIMIFDPIRWSLGGHGYTIYGVSFSFNGADLDPVGPGDGIIDWAGPSGDWNGKQNNTNPLTDNQETLHWTVRSMMVDYEAMGHFVPCYFAPHGFWYWDGLQETHCEWTLPDPQNIGNNPTPEEWANCGGHSWNYAYGNRTDTRADGFGTKYTIRYVPAHLPLVYEPNPFEAMIRQRALLAKALVLNRKSNWREIIARQEDIIEVTESYVAYRNPMPPDDK